MFAIQGTYQAGQGIASAYLRAQLPLISAGFPEVAACHPGTINLLLDAPLLVVAPEYFTPALD